jgi:hypothetical protein
MINKGNVQENRQVFKELFVRGKFVLQGDHTGYLPGTAGACYWFRAAPG